MTNNQMINEFVTLAIQAGGWMELDRLYLTNQLRGLLKVSPETLAVNTTDYLEVSQLIKGLTAVATEQKVISDSLQEQADFAAKLGDFLTPPPSVINALFAEHHAKDPEGATNYFYQLMVDNGYVKVQLADTLVKLSSPQGDFLLNQQPLKERDLEEASAYPQCSLCLENEGYLGSANQGSQANRRGIRMNLAGESWIYHYLEQPKVLEHCAFVMEEHQPLVQDQSYFSKLTDLLEVFPHYYIFSDGRGEHGHYQGGKGLAPMTEAQVLRTLELPLFKAVSGEVLVWPVLAIKLRSTNAQQLSQVAFYLSEQWRNFSQAQGQVGSLIRLEDGTYELYLIFKSESCDLIPALGFINDQEEIAELAKTSLSMAEAEQFLASL